LRSGLLTRVEIRHKASAGTSLSCLTLMARRTRPTKARGGQQGRHRSDPKRFPYEARAVGGKVMMPADLQRIDSSVLNGTMTGMISEEMRAVVESLWPRAAAQAAAESGLIASIACAITIGQEHAISATSI
jgi:hypothetical protein